MSELLRLRRSEGYGVCDDDTKEVLGIECKNEREPVFIAGGWRIVEEFCRCWRQIFAGIRELFQENLTKNSGKRPGKALSYGCEYSS